MCVCNVCETVSRAKDGVELSSNEHTVIDCVPDEGQYTLTIDAVTASDAGQYTVTAGNQFGKSKCTATLLIQG